MAEDSTITSADAGAPEHYHRKRKPLRARIAGDAAGAAAKGASTVSAIIKTTEAKAPPFPKGAASDKWHTPRGPPGLPTLVKFNDLKAAGIVANYCALRILTERHGFPKGRWLGSMTHVWSVSEVLAWLDKRPHDQPLEDHPVARRKK